MLRIAIYIENLNLLAFIIGRLY